MLHNWLNYKLMHRVAYKKQGVASSRSNHPCWLSPAGVSCGLEFIAWESLWATAAGRQTTSFECLESGEIGVSFDAFLPSSTGELV